MSARILVVDDEARNRKLLETRLLAEYFDVLHASSGAEALEICARGGCDIVLLDVMMPGMDGFEVCRRLKQDPRTHHLPVVMITSLDQPSDRMRGFEAGADDFLTKPIDEIALTTRMRSLARLKVVLDELRTRAMTAVSLGMPDPVLAAMNEETQDGRILVLEDRASLVVQIKSTLNPIYTVDVEQDPQEGLFKGVEGAFDLFILSLGLKGYDGLRLCSQFRALARTRHIPILLIADPEDRSRILRGLDLGANDYLLRPIDRNELLARVRSNLRRKRYADSLQENVQASIQMAVVDTLTGLNNRRFFESNFAACLDDATRKAKPLCLMLLDIDFFKRVNDTFGHEAGDQILKAFSARVRRVVRARDLICRLGGEEFGILMPDTTLDIGRRVAERVRSVVESDLFTFAADQAPIRVTVSIGLAERGGNDGADGLMRRADAALYKSKGEGRNRVTAAAA